MGKDVEKLVIFLKMVLENVGVTKFIHLNLSVVKPIIHL